MSDQTPPQYPSYPGSVQLLDVLWPLWDDRKQCRHDKVVGSVVIAK
ncbi:MAG: hypothetical protein M3Q98_08470 [Actinomycetota bacterium]|nr:hypothetical protein [Actinomycetota bacterium]